MKRSRLSYRRTEGPRMIARIAVLTALLAVAAWASAQERPSEEEMFGGSSAQPSPKSPPAGAGGEGGSQAGAGEKTREEELFGQPPAAEAAKAPPQASVSKEREDPLRIGGQIYLRAATAVVQDQAPARWALSSPNLVDAYLDARPNDRVRGYVLERMFYDPTAPRQSPVVSLLLGAPDNPSFLLDQLWVNFDVARTAFVTAGKQHFKWGVGRFWNPTDWLHAQRRDPLAVFDVRSGATMVKVHVPWEARGWNAYAVALLEDLDRQPAGAATSVAGANTVRGTALGARAEIVLGSVEIGADALAKDGRRPRFGVDVSAGVWDLDLYAGVALRTSPDLPRWREVAPAASFDQRYALDHSYGFTPAVVAGGEWSTKYTDEDRLTIGGEYFFDDSGYADPAVYPFLQLGAPAFTQVATTPVPLFLLQQRDPGAFTPFYLGRHYAGAFLLLPAPGRWNDTTFTLSGVGNLSDHSFVVRLDHSVLALTYLRIETYVAAHLGAKDGEFRLGAPVPPPEFGSPVQLVPAPVSEPGATKPTIFSAGVAVRVSL